MLPPLLVLFLWPLVSLVVFRKLSLPLAIIVTILGGFLLLPENTALNLPGIPSLDKRSIPALTALILAMAFADRATLPARPASLFPKNPAILFLITALVFGAVMTVLTNTDPLRYGMLSLPGLRLYDAGSAVARAILMILPLLLARRYLAAPEAQLVLLQALCVAALGYSLLALFEVRMSPQLNNWVYGFFPHSWIQHVRGGAFRPVVFLQHGLVLGIFLCMAILATLALVRLDRRRRGKLLLAAVWLFGTLILSRNLGALFITLALVPVVLLLGARGQLLAAAIISGVFLAYPVARTSQALPIAQVVQLAEEIDPDRASSFVTRLDNEEQLLAKASERALFGWGGWGRSRVYDAAGRDITIADGAWVITLGVSGWTGYVARYGLLTLPIFLLLLRRRREGYGLETSALAVLLAANLVDLVPNSANTPLTWLVAGALWGRLEWRAADNHQRAPGRTGGGEPHGPPAPEGAAGAVLMMPQTPYTRQTRRIERKRPEPETEPASR